METLFSIKHKMRSASCSELNDLLAEADSILSSNLEMISWARSHIYREYNKRKFLLCGGAEMIEPFDGGYRPIGDITFGPTDAILLEDDSSLLLEDGSEILLEI